MSFSLAHNSKKTNYEELFSVAQCANKYYNFSIYCLSNYFFLVLYNNKLFLNNIKINNNDIFLL